jgi:DNA-binding NarL/FixJ family response regulator
MDLVDTVLIAHQDAEARARLFELLQGAGYDVREADRGDNALEIARATLPDAVITDIPLAGICGYELCHRIKTDPSLRIPVIFVTGVRTEWYDRIAGLLLKADDYIVEPYAAGELLARVANLIRSQTSAAAPTGSLTKREEEVLELMSDGLRHNEIARRLFISPKTVATHVEHILRKLRVRSKTEAVVVAYRKQLISPKMPHGPAPPEPRDEARASRRGRVR